MREKQKQPASFQPDRILSYFKMCIRDSHLRYERLVRGRLYIPNQRYELHHRICNLRYGTPGVSSLGSAARNLD